MIDARMVAKCGEILFSDARHKALYGGRASGRSWSIATYVIARACEARKRIVCARQFQNSIKDSSKELIEKRIHDLNLTDQFAITERSITHNETQSDFLFVGLERNVESIRSLEGADIVWVEEAKNVSARSLEILLPTVRAPGSELIWSWNPELPDDPVDAFFRKGDPPPNSRIAHVTYLDNRFFQDTALPAEMERMKALNPARYRHVWLGEYDVSFESRVFPDVSIGRVEVPPNVAPRFGFDYGFGSDPSCILKLYVIEATRQLYISREAYGRVPLDQLPDMLDSVVGDRGNLIKGDSANPGVLEFLAARGFGMVGARKGPGSIREGVALLQSYRIILDPSCEAARREFHQYSWPTDRLTGMVVAGVNPVGVSDHSIDCARYACEDLLHDAPLDADDDGVLWLDLWDRGPRLRRADPLPAWVPDDELSYVPLPKRQRRVD